MFGPPIYDVLMALFPQKPNPAWRWWKFWEPKTLPDVGGCFRGVNEV